MWIHPIMALVPAAAVNFVDLGQVAGDHLDPCPDAVPVAPSSAQPDLNPVVLARAIVSQECGFSPRVEDHDVDFAVIVQVVEGGAAAAAFHGQTVTGASRDVYELPAASVLEQKITFLVTGGVIPKFDVVLEVSA